MLGLKQAGVEPAVLGQGIQTLALDWGTVDYLSVDFCAILTETDLKGKVDGNYSKQPESTKVTCKEMSVPKVGAGGIGV